MKLTIEQKADVFETASAIINRFPQSIERRHHLKANASIIINAQGNGFLKATNKVGYAIRAAINMLDQEENSTCWVSLDEEGEDGRLIHEPAAAVTAEDELDPESQLPEYKQEFCDFLRVNGLKGIAKLWGCNVRTVQIKFKKLLQDEEGRRKGKDVQGDLFGGAL